VLRAALHDTGPEKTARPVAADTPTVMVTAFRWATGTEKE
jgi:hypothetical protein